MIYENSYMKVLYFKNGRRSKHGLMEIQATKYPFHSGGKITITDGYSIEVIREWKNFKHLLISVRSFIKEKKQ